MLRRNSSRNKQRRPLSRSKSTSCIVRNPVHSLEFIDPLVAERDAHLAAVLSFNRARARYSEDMASMLRDPASYGYSINDSEPSILRQSLRRSDSATSRWSGHTNAPAIKRQQSIRFAGPTARPRRDLATRTSETRPQTRTPTLGLGILEDADNRPVSAFSYGGMSSDAHSYTRRYLHSLQPSDNYYTPEDDVASEPSSYRRLRRSRSMFTSSRLSNSDYCHEDDTSAKGKASNADCSHVSLKKENEPLREPELTAPELRAPKSMSFLRNRNGKLSSRSSSRAENDLAVHLAREKFRDQLEQPSRLSTQQSMFFRSKTKRGESSGGLRRSLRSTSNDSTAMSGRFGDTLSVPKQGSLRKTARKVSRSLKTKLKGLFARPKSAEEAGSPTEEATVFTFHDLDGESCLRLDDVSPPEGASMSRVPSHVPSLHAVPSYQQMRSRKGSVESAGGEQQDTDEKSRVTSWTNSITNTDSSQGVVGECDHPRLSIIAEQSLDRQPRVVVDSERVYSALMRRVEEAKQQKMREKEPGEESVRAYAITPSRSGSVGDAKLHRRTPSTIRCVREDANVWQTRRQTSAVNDRSSSESPLQPPRSPTSPTHDPFCETYPNSTAEESANASPNRRRTGTRGEHESPVALSHRSSAFFASPTCHLFRTTSPYRRALQENMRATKQREETELSDSKYLESLSELSLPLRRPDSPESGPDPRAAYAESIYSSTADDSDKEDLQPAAEQYPRSSAKQNHGDVTIFLDKPEYKPNMSHRRDVSTASSVEWKTWLSAHVSKLEAASPPHEDKAWSESALGLPRLGHVRELAEIEPEGEISSVDIERPDGSPVRGKMAELEDPCPSRLPRQPGHESSIGKPWVHNENEAPDPSRYLPSALGSPPIPAKSKLRSVPSLPLIKRGSDPNTPSSPSKIPRMRSLNTIGSRNSPREEALLKRRSRARLTGPGSSAQSSPGLTPAVERQFGMAATGSPAQRHHRVNQHSPALIRSGGAESYGHSDFRSSAHSQLDAQTQGSKRIVDMFLNSRRRKTDSSETGNGSSPVFL